MQESTTETVHGFAGQLAGWSLAVALEGLLDSEGVVAAHEAHKREADQWASALGVTSNLAEALLGPPQ